MNRWQSSVVLGLGLVFAAACEVQAKDEVPYKDRVAAVFEPVDMDEETVTLAFETVGQATQLGRFTSEGEIVVDLEDLSFEGVNTLTAANGDQIFLDITSGSLTPSGDDDGLFAIELETEFTGGTGRFENVSGGFSGMGTLDMIGQTFAGDGEGTISPPGKNKKK